MMRARYAMVLTLISTLSMAQTTINFTDTTDNKLFIKLYGQIDYNQKIEKDKKHAGVLDVHRLVTLFGYQFNRKTKFISEIEVEHVNEIFIEQAFVKHRIGKNMDLKAGLIIIPMGMVNEYHEPTFFYSVERPLLDRNIIPSTWREIGLGITGLIPKHSLKYQLYLMNSPISFSDGEGTIKGSTGFRSGRQKASKSIITTLPALSGQLEYYGLNNTKIGISTYHGKTNTSLYGSGNQAMVDSSTVTLSMVAIHGSMDYHGWTTRLQYVISNFGNASDYNDFADSDVPEMMHGFYALLAYDFDKSREKQLSPFIRYAYLDNHFKVTNEDLRSDDLRQNVVTIGLNYKPNPGVVFKVDYQFYSNGSGNEYQQFNSGVGVWF